MAKQRFGINDGYRGTVGTVIGYQWRGQWCLRARPRFVHNPRTERQQQNRQLFKAVWSFATQLRMPLRTSLRQTALESHMTECNRFMHLNKGLFAIDTEGRLTVDYENLAVSEGPVVPVEFRTPILPSVETQPAASPDRQIHRGETRQAASLQTSLRTETRQAASLQRDNCSIVVPFEKNPLHRQANGDDEVYVLALCPDLEDNRLSASAYRRQKSISITLPDEWQGHEVHLYGFVVDYAGRASESAYIGCLVDRADNEGEADGGAELALENVTSNDTVMWVVSGLESCTMTHDELGVWRGKPLGTAKDGGDELRE